MERDYESMMIIRSQLKEEDSEGIFNKISTKITDLGGKVLNAKIWAKEKTFAFPLRSRGAGRKRYNKGCYWLVNFNLDTDKLDELKKIIKLEEDILRHIIIRKEKGA